MTTSPAPSSYDEVPYINAAFAQSHPDRLATVARLFRTTPPAIATARVLELGCASGDNLIPMALGLPEARFLGIDLSRRQIEQGQRTIHTLSLANIELRHANIAQVDATYGKFDYIVCHGIYSWVPPAIREKIMAICRDSLVPNGVAYVSYNTFPGWRMRGMIRDMMVYHARQFDNPQAKIQQARALLDFLAQSAPTETPYGVTLRSELDQIRNQADSYIYHEYLEEVNDAIYFHDFVTAADRHDLQFLGEAEFGSMIVSNFSPQIAETLRRVAPDIVRMEQYMDFVRNRTFRQTLLVHKSAVLNRTLDWNSIRGLYVATAAQPASRAPSTDEGVPELFKMPNNATMSTSGQLIKTALLVLAEAWPQGVQFEDLVERCISRLGGPSGAGEEPSAEMQILGNELVQCYGAGMIALRAHEPNLTLTVSEKPFASPLARLQAGRPGPCTNLRHEPVNLDSFNRQFLPLLDGTRNRAALLDALTGMVQARLLDVKQNGVALHEGPALQKVLEEALDENLPRLAKAALFRQ